MRYSNVEFHQLEEYECKEHGPTNERSVLCTFYTKRFGYLQIGFDEGGVYQLDQEPDLYMFTDSEKNYIENCLAIAWRIVFDAPAAKDRFA